MVMHALRRAFRSLAYSPIAKEAPAGCSAVSVDTPCHFIQHQQGRVPAPDWHRRCVVTVRGPVLSDYQTIRYWLLCTKEKITIVAVLATFLVPIAIHKGPN